MNIVISTSKSITEHMTAISMYDALVIASDPLDAIMDIVAAHI